jgi:hypothetical protein
MGQHSTLVSPVVFHITNTCSRFKQCRKNCNKDRAVGRATGYGLNDGGVGVRIPGRVKKYLFSMSFRPVLESTQLPIQWVAGALFPEVKRPGREADDSTLTNPEVKGTWIYTSTSLYAFMA